MTFEGLVKKISPTLKRITYKLNGHFASFNHDDLYQEALLHLWQAFNTGKLSDKTDSYILQGCFFHLKNYIRVKKEKAKVRSLQESLYKEEESYTAEETLLIRDEKADLFFDDLNTKLLAETIRNNGLTSKEKFIISLCAEGLTTREIGSRVGVSHVSVVKSMSKIREKCKKYLD